MTPPRGKPAAVCASLSRSVVTSANYEARPFGIRAGMPVQEAKRKCPSLILVEGDHSKYTEASAHIFSMMKDYTPLVEVPSIDEAYLDVTQSLLLFKSALHIAQSIKDRVREKERLTCSIGVAPNKLLAKLGSRLQKPDGLVIIEKDKVEEILRDLPVTGLHGIGPKLEEALKTIGISTCGQLGKVHVSFLKKRFGVIGERLHEYPPDTSASPTDNLKRIGEPGRKKSTGINTNRDMRKKNGMIRKRGNINQAGARARENRANRSSGKI